MSAAHAEGLYVGGSVGVPDYRTNINGISGNSTGAAGKLFAGYQLAPNFALEGGLYDLGHIDHPNGSVNLRGGYLDVVAKYEFEPKWSVLGSVGVADGRFTSTRGDDSSAALKLGVGVQYDITKDVAVVTEYEHYRYANAYEEKPNAGSVTVGVTFGF